MWTRSPSLKPCPTVQTKQKKQAMSLCANKKERKTESHAPLYEQQWNKNSNHAYPFCEKMCFILCQEIRKWYEIELEIYGI